MIILLGLINNFLKGKSKVNYINIGWALSHWNKTSRRFEQGKWATQLGLWHLNRSVCLPYNWVEDRLKEKIHLPHYLRENKSFTTFMFFGHEGRETASRSLAQDIHEFHISTTYKVSYNPYEHTLTLILLFSKYHWRPQWRPIKLAWPQVQ